MLSALQWFYSIGGKFIRVVPVYTLVVIISTLISQVGLLLAFFLPLKVVILMGSSGVPRYFPKSWQAVDSDILVISLALAAVAFYLVYLYSEKISLDYSGKGAGRLVEKSRKITLFEYQEEIAKSAYLRYSRSLAGAVFTLIALFVIAALYPYLAFAVISYFLVVSSLLYLVCRSSSGLCMKIQGNLKNQARAFGSVGFLLAFAFIVIDFLLRRDTGVMLSIVCLLLVRQMMNRIGASVVDLHALYMQRLKINALFFHGHTLVEGVTRFDSGFWSLMDKSRRDDWVIPALADAVNLEGKNIECVWQQTGIAGVVAFVVNVFDFNDKVNGSYLIKLFNANRRSMAMHEAALFASPLISKIPAPAFLGTGQIDKYHYNLFVWADGNRIPEKELRCRRLEVAGKLLSYEPGSTLVGRYRRSRPVLSQRISGVVIKRLEMAASGTPHALRLRKLAEKIVLFRAILDRMPVQIVNPDLKPDTLLISNNGDIAVNHWGRWSIEPIGAGWPIQEKELVMLEKALVSAREHRPALIDVNVTDVRMAALMFAFEKFYNRQQYVNALELIPSVLTCIKSNNADQNIERD